MAFLNFCKCWQNCRKRAIWMACTVRHWHCQKSLFFLSFWV